MNKNESIKKIADEIGIKKPQGLFNDTKTALKVASELLMKAASKQRNSDNEIDDLKNKVASLENQLNCYKQEKLAEEKTNKVCKIVDSMYHKGILKKADTETKKEELQKLSMDALDAMETTISMVPEKKAQEYVSDLTFVCGDNNIKDKKDLSSSLADCVNNL